MKACTSIILALICEAVAHMDDYYDVGTVLFSPSDRNKKLWSTSEIALLRARKNFLDLIPPPDILFNSQNDDFASSILDYFRDAYKTLNRNDRDTETDSLLKTALSDTIGGYMKMWILPVTKFAYYGGTVPQDDALQLFQFHEDIKRYLNTNGKGWHTPRANFLNSIPVNVAPFQTTYPRHTFDPCSNLAYFEKTKSGLAIPVPNVNWNKDSESMFVPLKNQSLISLNSPNSSHTLFKYYDTAKNCIQSSNIEEYRQFDERLQNWLVSDVIPHLTDEKLYPGLRSVLTLVNKTRNLCDTVIDLYKVPAPTSKRTTIAGIPIDLSSKKMVVITIVILLEIVWCIPTLCYLMFTRMKKKNNKNNVYFFIEPKKDQSRGWPESTQCTPVTNVTQAFSKEVSVVPSKRSTGFSLTPQTRSFNAETHFSKLSERSVATGTRSNFYCQLVPTEAEIMYDHGTSRKSSSKILTSSIDILPAEKKPSLSFGGSNCVADSSMLPDKETASKTASFITVQELKPTKTVTILHESGRTAKKLEYASYVSETKKLERPHTGKKKNKGPKKYAMMSTDDFKRRPHSAIVNQQSLGKEIPPKVCVKHSDHCDLPKSNKSDLQTDVKVHKALNISSDKPLLKITSDRPQREICVDISIPIKTVKPSKIPKRFFTNTLTQTHFTSRKEQINQLLQSNRKSMIPQLKMKEQFAVDDIIIQSKKPKGTNLNLTL